MHNKAATFIFCPSSFFYLISAEFHNLSEKKLLGLVSQKSRRISKKISWNWPWAVEKKTWDIFLKNFAVQR